MWMCLRSARKQGRGALRRGPSGKRQAACPSFCLAGLSEVRTQADRARQTRAMTRAAMSPRCMLTWPDTRKTAMANRKSIAHVITVLAEAWNRKASGVTHEAYFAALADVPDAAVDAASRAAIRSTREYMPTPGQL